MPSAIYAQLSLTPGCWLHCADANLQCHGLGSSQVQGLLLNCPAVLLQEQQSVADFVDKCLMVWGEEVKPGEADNAPHMTHMWEPLRVFPKPLFVHVFSEAAAQVYCIVLRAQSFEHRRHQVGNHPDPTSSLNALC